MTTRKRSKQEKETVPICWQQSTLRVAKMIKNHATVRLTTVKRQNLQTCKAQIRHRDQDYLANVLFQGK